MKQKRITIILMLFSLAAGFAVWNKAWSIDYVTVYGENGVFDLRGFDFSNDYAVLRGPVEYIPNALLTPEEFDVRAGEALIGYPEDAGQYATSRIRVLLPDDAGYTFDARSIDFSQRLYVNGEWFLSTGNPGETKETTIPDTSRVTFILKPQDGVVEIVQQAANFVHRENGGHNGWHVGPPTLAHALTRINLEAAVVVGCYLALFIIHIMLYLMLRRYRANLYFALFCLMWFLRSGVTGNRIFSYLAPWMSWTVKFRIEYMTFPVTAVLLVSLLNILFPRVLQKGFLYTLYGVSAVFAGLFLFTDTLFMSYALPVLEVIYVAAIVYILIRFVMKLRRPGPEQTVFLAGAGLFLFSAVWDMFFYNNIIRFRVLGSEWSMLIFTFFAAATVFIATMREVEEAKEAEQRMALENAVLNRVNRAKSDLMATVSHETRTPLAVLSGYAELISMEMRRKGVDEQTASDLDQIADETQRIAKIMEEMQNLSRATDSRSKARIQLADVIRQSTRLYAPILERKKNKLTVNVPEDLPTVYANADEFTQVMFNLLQNVRNHTENGEVTVSAQLCGADFIEVTVTDTGAGIAPELLPRVFEQGVSGTEDGTGLGLAICKKIIEAHSGRIEIDSQPGKGTTVNFTLPITEKGEDEDYDGTKNGLIG